ncbi:MAG: GNAT family N-acetyltransferase [Firmicutes bacterium]|nr:GNAT family N-acetyltransferase [Bacillota bacterium]
MLRYRICGPRDCSVWVELNRAFMREEINDNEFWNEADKLTLQEFRDLFMEGLEASEQVKFLLFEEDEEPIGFANLMISFSVWSHGKAMFIDDLYFKSGERGRGNGKEAMHMIEEYARELGCKRIQLHTEHSNTDAIEFYKAIGYMLADVKFCVKYLEEE